MAQPKAHHYLQVESVGGGEPALRLACVAPSGSWCRTSLDAEYAGDGPCVIESWCDEEGVVEMLSIQGEDRVIASIPVAVQGDPECGYKARITGLVHNGKPPQPRPASKGTRS